MSDKPDTKKSDEKTDTKGSTDAKLLNQKPKKIREAKKPKQRRERKIPRELRKLNKSLKRSLKVLKRKPSPLKSEELKEQDKNEENFGNKSGEKPDLSVKNEDTHKENQVKSEKKSANSGVVWPLKAKLCIICLVLITVLSLGLGSITLITCDKGRITVS